ncbi:MAG: PDZ domain-containing protein [Candidatus Delongbacteria bacterium]|nr:PDZ domain-containing protein [Candidatus Delongbacteria bacterium]
MTMKKGYYRFPTLSKDYIYFTSEGDIWRVDRSDKIASRVTSHHGVEYNCGVSPSGEKIAFTAQFNGFDEVFFMDANGGIPEPIKGLYEPSQFIGWIDNENLIFSSNIIVTLPETRLYIYNINSFEITAIELNKASDGCFDENKKLYFVRLPFQGSHTKRYRGGDIQNIWYFDGENEAFRLFPDFEGIEKRPMLYDNRIYFLSDRDGLINIWSSLKDGHDLTQHTFFDTYDITHANIYNNEIIFSYGADIFIYDIVRNCYSKCDIYVNSDFEQLREKWIDDPLENFSGFDLSDDGKSVLLNSRGKLFEVSNKKNKPIKYFRFNNDSERIKKGRFYKDGYIYLSDKTGEYEFYYYNGKENIQLTSDSNVLIHEYTISPNGDYLAYTDKNYELFIVKISDKKKKKIAFSEIDGIYDLTFSPDSNFLAYSNSLDNRHNVIFIYSLKDKSTIQVTSDRYNSYQPKFSDDGNWIYFMSERNFDSKIDSPWGHRQPEPYYNNMVGIYTVALKDENLTPIFIETPPKCDEKEDKEDKKEPPVKVEIDKEGIIDRVFRIPINFAAYDFFDIVNDILIFTEEDVEGKIDLYGFKLDDNCEDKKLIISDIDEWQISNDNKKLAVLKDSNIYIFDVPDSEITELENIDENLVVIKNFSYSVNPVEEFKQLFAESWRLERDYFYDRNLHGIDYKANYDKYLPLLERVSDRDELNDLIANMVSEISALHTFVNGGDLRRSEYNSSNGFLGVKTEFTNEQCIISSVYKNDPEETECKSPLSRPDINACKGDIIHSINGIIINNQEHFKKSLIGRGGASISIEIKKENKTICKNVNALTFNEEKLLRYNSWVYYNRNYTENVSDKKIGYVHLKAMGKENIGEWTSQFYPVYNREGLIIDVRNNRGGNIDSWILEKLLRKAWFYWQPRTGKPYWNMQYAFRGKIVVLCNEKTASDGEAFTEGIRKLGLGTIIGKRTWGGEIWLSYNNLLKDRGIASAAQSGVFDENGNWLIEGIGVIPDIEIDNLPNESFYGKDRQLDTAIEHLMEKIKNEPMYVPKPPGFPDLSIEKFKEKLK